MRVLYIPRHFGLNGVARDNNPARSEPRSNPACRSTQGGADRARLRAVKYSFEAAVRRCGDSYSGVLTSRLCALLSCELAPLLPPCAFCRREKDALVMIVGPASRCRGFFPPMLLWHRGTWLPLYTATLQRLQRLLPSVGDTVSPPPPSPLDWVRSPPTISGSGAGNQPPSTSPADLAKSLTPGLALAPVTPHQVSLSSAARGVWPAHKRPALRWPGAPPTQSPAL